MLVGYNAGSTLHRLDKPQLTITVIPTTITITLTITMIVTIIITITCSKMH